MWQFNSAVDFSIIRRSWGQCSL